MGIWTTENRANERASRDYFKRARHSHRSTAATIIGEEVSICDRWTHWRRYWWLRRRLIQEKLALCICMRRCDRHISLPVEPLNRRTQRQPYQTSYTNAKHQYRQVVTL